jgi:membrane associated rhomboid family serine protease
LKKTIRNFSQACQFATIAVLMLLVVKFLQIISPWPLEYLGIIPRNAIGLRGILFSPLLHRDLSHLLGNSIPLFVLLVLLYWRKKYAPAQSLLMIWIFSGLGTWLLGRPAIHIGASSVIYGLASYLIAAAFWMRDWSAVLASLFTLLFYGGIFYGVLPQSGPISWEGHLSGALAGLWVAWKNHS